MTVKELIDKLLLLEEMNCNDLPVIHSNNDIISIEIVNDKTGKPAFIKLKGYGEE